MNQQDELDKMKSQIFDEKQGENLLPEFLKKGVSTKLDEAVLGDLPGTSMRNPDFVGLLDEMRRIHDKKSHDYAEQDDLYKNFKECEDMGIPAWKGIVIRMTDKMSRVKGFCKRDNLAVDDESIEQTLLDLANYSLLAILVRRCRYQGNDGH